MVDRPFCVALACAPQPLPDRIVAGQTDNPDQRIAEDVYRFINGGSDGSNTAYGIYDFSILLISTVSSLVSFAVETKHLVLAEGENVVLSGPSGSGKSTLFRAIAGIWPFGEGRIHIPAGIRVMVVPAKPYIPISTFRAAVTYPAVPGTYSDDDIRRALDDTHLGDLVNELDREEVWSQRLSSGEQQRVALARALLMRPDWLFLDQINICGRRKAGGQALRRIGATATKDNDNVHRPPLGCG